MKNHHSSISYSNISDRGNLLPIQWSRGVLGRTSVKFRRLKSVLALIGGVALTGAVMLYIQGWMVARNLDPNATEIMGGLIGKALESNFATASTIRIPLAEGVGIRDAIRGMEQRAISHGMKPVGHLALHGEIPTIAEKTSPYLDIFSFHCPAIFPLILENNRALAAYMPWRIVLHQDKAGNRWLSMMDPKLLIHGGHAFEPKLRSQMITMKNTLLDILAAGATGARK